MCLAGVWHKWTSLVHMYLNAIWDPDFSSKHDKVQRAYMFLPPPPSHTPYSIRALLQRKHTSAVCACVSKTTHSKTTHHTVLYSKHMATSQALICTVHVFQVFQDVQYTLQLQALLQCKHFCSACVCSWFTCSNNHMPRCTLQHRVQSQLSKTLRTTLLISYVL